MSDRLPKARPYYRSAVALVWLASGFFYVSLGVTGTPVTFPPAAVFAIGCAFTFAGGAAAWLAYWHFKLRATVKDIDRARAGPMVSGNDQKRLLKCEVMREGRCGIGARLFEAKAEAGQ